MDFAQATPVHSALESFTLQIVVKVTLWDSSSFPMGMDVEKFKVILDDVGSSRPGWRERQTDVASAHRHTQYIRYHWPQIEALTSQDG